MQGRGGPFAPRWIAALTAATGLALAGCGSGTGSAAGTTTTAARTGASSGTTPGSPTGGGTTSTTILPLFSGNTSTVVFTVGQHLGCVNEQYDDQIDDHANAKATCLFQQQSITLLSFVNAADEQAWVAEGPESADNSGTVVLGNDWAVALFDPSQAGAVQHLVGGSVQQMP